MSCFPLFRPLVWLVLVSMTVASVATARGAEKKGKIMSYGEARDYLAKHTKLIELTSPDGGARVAVTPEWQGRVMTSTCGGLEGPSFGFIHRDFIDAGKNDMQFNNYGAEDRMWLCPEGGQFSLWFKPGEKQTLKNWRTPPAFNEGPWTAVSDEKGGLRMTAHMKFQNTSATAFDLGVVRDVQLLGKSDFKGMFGEKAAAMLDETGVKTVGYETVNTITNRGPEFSKEKGLVSIWILGMMNSSPKCIILVPYKAGSESELGPTVKSNYFGVVPADRLKVTPEAILFRADNNYRSKIGVSQKRARNVLGSIDFASGVLTLVQFNMPKDPTKHNYINNMWEMPQAEPFKGDVVNAYNDGPNDLGKQLGAFYEIETISPAPVLKNGESLTHCHRTVHIQADADTLDKLAAEVLGVDLDAVRNAMLKK